MRQVAVCVGLLVHCAVAIAQPAVRNGAFEDGLNGWTPRISENMGEVRLVDDGAGGKCAQFHKTVATPNWSCIGVTQKVSVDPNSEYLVSLRFRSVLEEGIVGYACRVFATGEGLDDHRAMSPSEEWTPWEWQFRTGLTTTEITLQVVLTYSSGELWVDDVALRKVGGSLEAEAFAQKTDAQTATDGALSEGEGVTLGSDGSVSTTMEMDAGAWRIEVFGEGTGAGDGLTRRAVTVRLDGRSQTVDLHRHGTKLHGRVAYLRTEQAGEQDLTLSRAEGYDGRLVLDRVAWVAYDGPHEARPLCRETQLVVGGKPNAAIVASADAAMQRAARSLRSAIRQKSGAELPLVDHEKWMSGDRQSQHALAVGNMLQNKLTERLYCLWYTFEDCWYPGPGGWVVRTVHDPWGTGKNVVVLAGSDDAGTAAAVEQFTQMLGDGPDLSVGHTIKAKMAPEVEEGVRRACGTPDPEYARSSLDRRSQRSLMSSAARVGMSYARSGDPNRARMLVVYLLEHKRRPELGHDTHMELWKVIRAWDSVEECPAITDDERLEITNYLLHVLRSPEGVFNSMFAGSLGRSTVRHNHHMLAAMDAYYGGHYFKKYYQLKEADDWLAKAKFCFASQEAHDKGQDESGNYEMSTALRPLLPYAYTEPGYQFLPSGAGKRFLDRCCLSIDNRYSLSGHGDCWDVNCFAPLALGIGAWYYRDGGYQYILQERHRTRANEKHSMQIQPPFRMDGVVKPERPTRFEGVTVAPVSEGHYELYHGGGDLKWNVPREEAFDKISFRTRFEPDAQYLLLDGIACGSHGHRDANCLIRFTDNDRVWLVDDSYTEGPFLSDHNGVVVTRDGMAESMPACARLDAAVDFEETGLSRTTLPDHSGVDWERNVLWVKETCFVVLDRMKAAKPGNYGFRCLWRTLGTATLDGNRLTTRQEAVTPERKDAMHLVSGGGVRASFAEDREDFGGRWRGKYEYAEPVVDIHSQDATRELAAGEAFTFANLLYATNTAEPHSFDLAKIDGTSALVTGDERMLVGTADAGSTVGGTVLSAGPFVIRDQSLTAAVVTSVTVDGVSVLTSRTPVGISLNLAARKLIVQVEAPTLATVLGEARQLQKGRTEFDVRRVTRTSFGRELDEAAQKAQKAQHQGVQSTRETTPNVTVAWQFDAGSAVHALIRDGDNVVVGTEDGTGLLLNARGKELWRIKAEGRINAASVGDLDGNGLNEYVFASEDAHVYAVDATGKTLWQFKCPPYPKRGGKLGQARDVLVSDLDGDGKAEVIVGANNIELHILEGSGKQLRSFPGDDPKMTFNNFSTIDLNGDGKKTILTFPSSGSFGYGMEFDLAGRAERFSTDGWPSHIRDRAEVDLNGDGKLDFACATNRGNVYYRVQTDDGLSNKKVFAIGCPVTAMAGLTRPGESGLVAVGIDASYVHVLNGEGKPVWKQPTGSPVTDVEFVSSGGGTLLAVGTVEGAVLFFGEGGEPAGAFAAGSRTNAIARAGSSSIVGGADGRVKALTVVGDVDA